jgi:Lantibiotic dehydratase, N terminus
MPGPASMQAAGQRRAAPAQPHLMPLTGEWALWRDLAVRSAGFPVSGLDVFGSQDERAGLQAVARDPLFREAVTWQNRAAVRNAIGKVAAGSPAGGSDQRRREEVVASYWQRYCGKNDTIGFFGPLAWGCLADDGPAIQARCGRLVSERTVHFEAWAMQALAEALDADITVPVGPHSERDLRIQLEQARPDVRERGVAALDRLEQCRSALAHAGPGALDGALGDLDRVFQELTGRAPTRRPGATYAARTLVYLDCMRDLDLAVGPGLRAELAATLPPLLAGARWYCGRVYEAARQIIEEATAASRSRSLHRVLEAVLPAMQRLPEAATAVNGQLQRQWATLLADPDRAAIHTRAAAAFADYAPAWPISAYQSADVQIAAPDLAALNAGDYLCVVGDFHPGANPLGQGMFATRHPDRERFLSAIASDVGALPYLIPPRDTTTRNMPAITRPSDPHVAATSRESMPGGYHTMHAADLIVDHGTVTTPDGAWQAPLAHLLWLPMLIAAVHAFDPFPVDPVQGHSPRITIERTVWRRETWDIPAAQGPQRPEAAANWARDRGMPRRVFALSPSETKPIYVDFASPVLTRILCRQVRRAAADDPGRLVRFTEMLPAPEDCWLADEDGRRYTSELRLVAVDLRTRHQRPGSAAAAKHADPLAPFLAQGWRPSPGRGDPEFGSTPAIASRHPSGALRPPNQRRAAITMSESGTPSARIPS